MSAPLREANLLKLKTRVSLQLQGLLKLTESKEKDSSRETKVNLTVLATTQVFVMDPVERRGAER